MAKRPNIVLFLADDHGQEFSGCYGNPAARTPNIDRLASEGMRFTRAFTASPQCAPSRCVIMTGMYPFRTGSDPNHTPIRAGTDEWVITNEQRERMKVLLADFRARFPAVFIGVPWDEEEQGGCLASARGFIHISAAGDLEPCPFAPFSDTSLLRVSLREALSSRVLRVIRENHSLFAETDGGCALWRNRTEIEALLREKTG